MKNIEISVSDLKLLKYHAQEIQRICCKLEIGVEASAQSPKPRKSKGLTDEQKIKLINKRKMKREIKK
ncbi:MAG: hypothetical protein KL787_09985 [Taibaiella sp.]|nr:hypothetical protein [Taibaiella sp.]